MRIVQLCCLPIINSIFIQFSPFKFSQKEEPFKFYNAIKSEYKTLGEDERKLIRVDFKFP